MGVGEAVDAAFYCVNVSRTGPLKVKRRQGAVGQTAPECEAIAVVWLDSVGYEVKETGGASMEAQDSDSDGV